MHLFATCFLALYLAHLVTDFVLQSDRLATGKRRGAVLAYAEHGGIHFLTAVLFFWALLFLGYGYGGFFGSMVS